MYERHHHALRITGDTRLSEVVYHNRLLHPEAGLVNAFLALFGIEGPRWLVDPATATRTELERVAAVIAHELAHVSEKHGLKAIRSARLTQAFSILAIEAGKAYSPAEVAERLVRACDRVAVDHVSVAVS